MYNIRITHNTGSNQSMYQDDTAMVTEPTKKTILRFAKRLVKEYGNASTDGVKLDVADLPFEEKERFLPYLCSQNEYADYLSSPTQLKTAIDDYAEDMQYYIDEVTEDVYFEFLEESGYYNSLEYKCRKHWEYNHAR